MINKMKRELEIINITTKEILFSLFDIVAPSYEAHPAFRQSMRKYIDNRPLDRQKFLERFAYLRRQGYIQTFTTRKEKYIELTPKGIERAQNLFLQNIKIIHKGKWDQKWRVVIFDIPEKLHHSRDIFRDEIKRLSFIQVQKSVYVFPFECTQEISKISQILNITKYVTIMISEIIQGEKWIIETFLKIKVLQKSDLK